MATELTICRKCCACNLSVQLCTRSQSLLQLLRHKTSKMLYDHLPIHLLVFLFSQFLTPNYRYLLNTPHTHVFLKNLLLPWDTSRQHGAVCSVSMEEDMPFLQVPRHFSPLVFR